MLKAIAAGAAVAMFIAGRPARADTLLTGAIRDQAGAAIAGAGVIAFDARSRRIGGDVSSADGTFAVAAQGAPATLAISCDYCEPVRLRVEPGEPVVVIVERFTAITARGPSPSDIRALPYRAADDIASLQAYTVIAAGRISDRALGPESALTIDGLPFYNAADGSTPAALIPAHAVSALAAASPLVAPAYGGYAAAGVYDLRLRDPDLATSRFDLGGAADVVARFQTASAGAAYAASSDTGEDRQAASAEASLPFAGGRLAFDALDLTDDAPDLTASTSHASGAGLGYTTESRRYSTSAALTATQTGASSFITASAAVRNRGPLGLEFGVRANRASSAFAGATGAQFDAAIFAGAALGSASSQLAATVAWDHGSDGGSGSARAGGLDGSLAEDVRLGPRWSAHAGVVSNLRVPTLLELAPSAPIGAAADRSLLFEQDVTYADLRRLRLSALAYSERSTGSALGHVNGIGAEAAWQIARRLSLRGWLLRANQSTTAAPTYGPAPSYGAVPVATSYGPPPYDGGPTTAAAPTRQLLWLSYEKDVRIDALMRGGALEGDLRVPLGPNDAFTIGSARYGARRVTTFGVTRRTSQ